MTPDSLHELFAASAGVAGALIGLLFVAISIEHERLTAPDADQIHRVRASAALIAFTNALTVSLFALIPGDGLAICSIVVGLSGLLFVIASVLSVRRVAHDGRPETGRWRNLAFLILILAVFAFQLLNGIRLAVHHHDPGAADDLAGLIVFSCLVGIYRSWELIGGPEIGFSHELRELVHQRRTDALGEGREPADGAE
jgi:hypothetical protein